MNTIRLLGTNAPASTVLIRLVTGWIFLSEGIQKFLFPQALGIGRFAQIGLPRPEILAPLVGVVEITAGLMLVAGLATRWAAAALFVVIATALATTKWPMLVHKGFWSAAHESRTDLAMAFCLLFLLLEGAGRWSLDARLSSKAKA